MQFLDHKEEVMRRSAVRAFGHVAERGDSVAIKMVISRLRHKDMSVRKACIEVLRLLIVKGDPRVVQLFGGFLEPQHGNDSGTRLAALETLTTLVAERDPSAFSLVAGRLADPHVPVCQADCSFTASL